MSKILIVGNVVKDVYLRLSDKHYETDGAGVPWLDLAFNGESHKFSQRTSVFGGSAVSREVLTHFGHEVLGVAESGVADDYRYILCAEDNLTYLTGEGRADTRFTTPPEAVDWIFVDRSAGVTTELVRRLKDYLGLSRSTRLAAYLEIHGEPTAAQKELAGMASVVFYDGFDDELQTAGLKAKITEDTIDFEGARISYVSSRAQLFTRLTTYSIIAGTLLGSLLTGRSVEESLALAKMNTENSKLTGTVGLNGLTTFAKSFEERRQNLKTIAKMMVAPGKGILAADESGGSIHKKFIAAGVPDDFEHRTEYRDMLLRDPNLGEYIGGVILFDETARSTMASGASFIDSLTGRGIIPGVKVDEGLKDFGDGEHVTAGLAGLPARLSEYYEMGLRFTKWRAAFECVPGKLPTDAAIAENCRDLAIYARECQEAGLVPIVEPEVVHAGSYSASDCFDATARVLDGLFKALESEKVNLAGCILKVNMVLAGSEFDAETSAEEVGKLTAKVLAEHVPDELAGVVFLSGGQGVEQATENLREVLKNGTFPWPVTFSFARALQGPAMDAWISDGIEAGTTALVERLKANCAVLKAE